MEFQSLLNLGLGTALTVLGWFAREMWAAVKDLKQDLAKLREEIPKSYMPRDEMRMELEKIHRAIERVFDKLDGKADK